MTSFSLPDGLQDYLFLDVEASGLHAASYPIEIGWANFYLAADSILIKPHQSWGDEGWSYTSEGIHGIARDTLLRDGLDLVAAAHRLNAAAAGRTVFSDRPAHDAAWTGRLFAAANVACTFSIADTTQLERTIVAASGLIADEVRGLQERVEQAFPHLHRAAADARRAAARVLCLALPDDIESIVAAA